MKYSIVVVTFNSAPDIGACLASVERNTRDFEVIVVDNASADGTREALKAFPWVKTRFNEKNQGFAAATNAGIRLSQGDYIILLNPDTRVFPQWASRMAEKFSVVDRVGAVGPLSTNCIGYQSVAVQMKEEFERDRDVNHLAEKVLANRGKWYENKILIGFCMMVPREVFYHVGLLDERLFLGNDDLELSWRLRIHGYKLVIALDAFIAHEMQKSFKTAPKPVTDRLVQESTDALYRKLVRRYGRRNLMTDMQLWGVNWFKPSPAAQAEEIGGPEQRLKILFAFHGSAESLPQRWARALKEYNEVTTVGFSTDPGHSLDIPLSRPEDDLVKAVELSGGFGKFDLFLFFDSGLPATAGSLSRIPIPTAGVLAGGKAPVAPFDFLVLHEYDLHRSLREKGVENTAHLALNACDEAPAGSQPPACALSFVGDAPASLVGSEGTLLKKLLELSAQYPLSFNGGNSKMAVDTGEGSFSLGALKAMAEGKLLLTRARHNRCPIQEFREGVHFAAYKDAESLEEKIRFFTAHPEKISEMGTAAKETALKRQTFRIQAVRLSGILREFLSLPRKARAALPLLPFPAVEKTREREETPPENEASLLQNLDDLQILNAAGGKNVAKEVEACRVKLKDLGVETPDPAPFFNWNKAGEGVPFRRYTQGLAGAPAAELDLNALDDPIAALKGQKNLGKSFKVRFKNFQSAETLSLLSQAAGAETPPPPAAFPARREFTYASAERLLSRCGFRVTAVEERPLAPHWMKWRQGEKLHAGRLIFKRTDFTEGEWNRFFSGEIVLSARERRPQSFEKIKVSIVILTFNQLDYTKLCLDSIRRHTPLQHELILIDNGSTDGTADWLKSEEEQGKIQKALLNGKNLGVAAGWNQGMKIATGNYILILNNDVIAAPGWLDAMLQCAESDPAIGMVGPMTNRISGFQQEAKTGYTDLAGFEPFAVEYTQKNAGSWWEIFRLVGFCLLVKRAAAEKVGLFDERFGKGNFEDDDYCLRVRAAGFRLMVAGDSFIHHFGSVSFKDSGIDWREQMQKNKALFDEKWEKIHAEKTAPAPRDAEFMAGQVSEAEALIESGDRDGAIGRLATVLEGDPANYVAHNLMGLCAWYKGKTGEAYFFFKKSVDLHPVYEDALLNFCDAALALGRPEEAVAAFEKALVQDPSLKEISRNLAKIKMEAAKALGAVDAGKLISARELNRKGEALISEGMIEKAEGLFKEILAADADNFAAVNNLGVAAWYRKDFENAYTRFSEALTLCPTYEDALVNLFDAALKLKRVPETAHRFESALVQNPALNDARRILTLIHEKSEKIYDVRHYSEVSGAAGLNAEGRKFLDDLKLNEATLKFLDSMQKHGENCDAYCGLGIIQFYRKNFGEAFALFRRAVSLNPMSEDALLNLHDTALKLERWKEVTPLLTQALAIDPTLTEIRKVLETGAIRP